MRNPLFTIIAQSFIFEAIWLSGKSNVAYPNRFIAGRFLFIAFSNNRASEFFFNKGHWAILLSLNRAKHV